MNFLATYPRATVAALLALSLFALISLFRSGQPPAMVREDLKTLHRDMVGQTEQLAGTLESGSRVVVLELDYALEAHGKRVYDRIFEALRTAGLDIVHVEPLNIDEAPGGDPNQAGFPYGEFIRVSQSFPDIDAVIALCGPPYGVEEYRRSPASNLPKLLVAGGVMGGSAEPLYDRGWLYAATVPRTITEDGARVLKYELLPGP